MTGGSPKRGHPVFIGSALCWIPWSYGENFWVEVTSEIRRSLTEDKVKRRWLVSNEAPSINKAGILRESRRIRMQERERERERERVGWNGRPMLLVLLARSRRSITAALNGSLTCLAPLGPPDTPLPSFSRHQLRLNLSYERRRLLNHERVARSHRPRSNRASVTSGWKVFREAWKIDAYRFWEICCWI